MINQPEIDQLFSSFAQTYTGEIVFDCLTDVVYFVKNKQAQYVVVNNSLAVRCGKKSKTTLIGKNTKDVFPHPLGKSFFEQDMKILNTGTPVINQLELHLYPSGLQGWCLTDKFPIYGKAQNILGIVGVSHDLHEPNEKADDYESVALSIQFASENLDQRINISQLAKLAKMSAYQFDKRVKKLFKISAGQLLVKLRMDFAAEQLRDTSKSISSISMSSGYADQSTFTRQFHRVIGLTPAEYRSNYCLMANNSPDKFSNTKNM